MSVYSSSKSYSPRFKSSAEFIERNIGSRVVNTVGSVGRRTGVEGGLRWALQRRQAADANIDSSSPSKRLKTNDGSPEAMDVEKGFDDISHNHTRRLSGISSAETLPPYDTFSSPNYDDLENSDGKAEPRPESQQQPWKTRIMVTTSGLGVAMSEESLRSLTYCLTWLRWANERLGGSILSLKQVLNDWDSSRRDNVPRDAEDPERRPQSPSAVSHQIQQLKGDVLQTLKQVVDVVSRYAGGALPDNARLLVRRHITSLPQRFRIASRSGLPGDGSIPATEMATSAHHVMVLAQEGLNIMAQVSNVVNDTLVSAEEWCGRLRRPQQSTSGSPSEQPPQNDVNYSADEKAPSDTELRTSDDVEMAGYTEK